MRKLHRIRLYRLSQNKSAKCLRRFAHSLLQSTVGSRSFNVVSIGAIQQFIHET